MKKLIPVLSLALVSQMAFAAQECSVDFSKSAPNTRYTYSDAGIVTDLKTGPNLDAMPSRYNMGQE